MPAETTQPVPGLGNMKLRRNALLDLLRLAFASLVLLDHAFGIPSGVVAQREPFLHTLHLSMPSGTAAVDGFFLLSGFLILRSWQLDPRLGQFLQKRALRIVPGYAVAVVLSLLVGSLFAKQPGFWSHLDAHTAVSIATLSAPLTPKVFPLLPYAGVNGSLWTITYEARCYLLVAFLGVLGLLRARLPWLLLTLLCFFVVTHPAWQAMHAWHGHYLLTGDPTRVYALLWPFLVGGCFALLPIPMRWWLVLAAVAGLLLSQYLPLLRQPAFFLTEALSVLFGGYVIFFAAGRNLRLLQWESRLPDVSYGTYLYGWPVQCILITFLGPRPWTVFALSLPLSLMLGWLSWHFIERPALRWKRGSTAPLPPP